MTLIVAIDDEPAILQAMGDYLEHFGFKVEAYVYNNSADARFADFCANLSGQPDIIIADYRLPGDLTGVQIVNDMRKSYNAEIPAILFTGDISAKTIGAAEDQDLHLLYKPVRMEKLKTTVEKILGINSSSAD